MTKTSTTVNPGGANNRINIILDKIGDIFWPIYKLAFGAEGEATIVDEDNPLPVAHFDGYGNPIRSFGGALNTHDACSHHFVYNQFLHYDTATTTTLSVAASSGDNQLNFTDTSSYSVGDEIKLENGSLEPVFFEIKVIVANLVTVNTPIAFDHPIGADVTKIHTNLATAGLTVGATLADPTIFTSHVPAGAIVHITNMSVVMTDTAAMDFTTFGGMVALINGCVLRAKSDGVTGSYTNWKHNLDLDSDAFPVRYQDKVGGGEFGLSAVYQIKEATGSIVYLDGSKNDTFELLAQDSLEGLTNFKIKLQGHYEGI